MIVEPDLGFVFWLGQVLDRVGYQALPAKSIPDAIELLSHWNGPVDVMIISPDLPESSSFTRHLRSVHADLRVIALTEQAKADFLADGQCSKRRGAAAQTQWLETIAEAFQSPMLHLSARGC